MDDRTAKPSIVETNNFQPASGKILLRKPRAPHPSTKVKKIEKTVPRSNNNEYPSDTVANLHTDFTLSCESLQQFNDELLLPSLASVRPVSSRPSKQKNGHNSKSALPFEESVSLVKPYKSKGPDPLPARVPKQQPLILTSDLEESQKKYYSSQIPEFTLTDFLTHLSDVNNISLEQVQQVTYSKYNYNQIQKLLLEKCQPKRDKISTVKLGFSDDDVPAVQPRIPQKQLLIELASIIKAEVGRLTGVEMKSAFFKCQKFNPRHKMEPVPLTEIVIYEPQSIGSQESQTKSRDSLPSREVVSSARSKYFQDSKRSGSPFEMADQDLISPSEVSILDTLMSGGHALSLKAHFISTLPDILLLANTLTYLNLSFNNFQKVPNEVCNLRNLTVLKMRNNPIAEIPAEISRLKHLSMLVVSYCLISNLPSALFALHSLVHLDFSYNKVLEVPSTIVRLKKLKELNAAGNQLGALPANILKLPLLNKLLVINNFMHPVFWKDYARQQIPKLSELSCMVIKTRGLDKFGSYVPDSLRKLFSTNLACDCCGGPQFGKNIRVIRPVSNIFGIRNLPIMFDCCSFECWKNLMSNSPDVLSRFYNADNDTGSRNI